MSRNVKGTLFVDYVRMLRSVRGVNWASHLAAEDLPYLSQRIEAGTWYPMATFERMGLAILAEVAGGEIARVREWGRGSIDLMNDTYAGLVLAGEARESLARFQALRRTFFDFPALEVRGLGDASAIVEVNYQMGAIAEEAAAQQTLGFFERLLELTGAKEIQAWFTGKAWAGAETTTIELRWKA